MVESVYSAVRTDFLYKADYASSLKGSHIIPVNKQDFLIFLTLSYCGYFFAALNKFSTLPCLRYLLVQMLCLNYFKSCDLRWYKLQYKFVQKYLTSSEIFAFKKCI
jgi:hypothetical protein